MAINFEAAAESIAAHLGIEKDKKGRYELPGGPKTAEGVVRMVWRALNEATARQHDTVVVNFGLGVILSIETPHHVGVIVRDYDSDEPDNEDADGPYKTRLYYKGASRGVST